MPFHLEFGICCFKDHFWPIIRWALLGFRQVLSSLNETGNFEGWPCNKTRSLWLCIFFFTDEANFQTLSSCRISLIYTRSNYGNNVPWKSCDKNDLFIFSLLNWVTSLNWRYECPPVLKFYPNHFIWCFDLRYPHNSRFLLQSLFYCAQKCLSKQ